MKLFKLKNFFCGMFFLAVFLIAGVSRVSAASYYVGPNGSNGNSGTSSAPFATLSYACGKAVNQGDVIYINANAGKVYVDPNPCNLAMGVKIQGAGKDVVTIRTTYPSTTENAYIFRETTPPGTIAAPQPLLHGNNDISGFTIDGSDGTNRILRNGIRIRGTDNIVIHDMAFKHTVTHAISLAGWWAWPDYETSARNTPPAWAYGDKIYNVSVDDCSSRSTGEWNDRYGAIDLEALANMELYNLTINENYPDHGTGIKAVPGWFKNFKGYNWDIKTDVSNSNAFVFEMYSFSGDSEIYNSTFNHSLSLNAGPATLDPGSTWNLKIHDTVTDMSNMTVSGSGHELSHNYLYFYNNYIGNHRGICAGVWATNYSTGTSVDHWKFANNVLYNCSDGLFVDDGNLTNIEIYNNVFDTMTGVLVEKNWGGCALEGSGAPKSVVGAKIKNNIIMNTAASPLCLNGMTNTVVDHNLLYANANNNYFSGGSGTIDTNNIRGVVPGIKYSGSRPNPFYLPSDQSSNLVDAGTNVGLPFAGNAPDIGAYEYAASNTCTGFVYSAWGTCTNGTQTRTITSATPSGCTGGSPVLSQVCTVTYSAIDVAKVFADWNKTLSGAPGDINSDGAVNIKDLGIMMSNWQ